MIHITTSFIVGQLAVIDSTFCAFLMARYYTKRPSYPEIKKLLDKYTNRNQDEDRGKWKYVIHYEPHDELDRPIRVPNFVYWQVVLFRRVLPVMTLILGAVLFTIQLILQ